MGRRCTALRLVHQARTSHRDLCHLQMEGSAHRPWGKQIHGVNSWDTYAPVVSWTSIRLHLILALVNGHHMRQINFVLAYPHADIECDMNMEIPQGFHHQGQKRTRVLQLLKNIYGTCQAGRVWNKHIHAGLIERGYRQSAVDHCVYYKAGQYRVPDVCQRWDSIHWLDLMPKKLMT